MEVTVDNIENALIEYELETGNSMFGFRFELAIFIVEYLKKTSAGDNTIRNIL